MKVLIIDDEANSVSPLIEELEQQHIQCHIENFPQDIIEVINKHKPDILVLDLKNGADNTTEPYGNEIFQKLWDQRFFPIIVYSAIPDSFDSKILHPFVHKIKKGKDSELEAVEWISSKEPFIKMMHEIDDLVLSIKHESMKSITSYLSSDTDTPDVATFDYLTRRRIAASLDYTRDEDALPAIVRYIYPPISDYLRLGDLIKKNDVANSIYMILTPSCDLGDVNQSPKVQNILVAQCFPVNLLQKEMQLSSSTGKKKNNIERLMKDVLTKGYLSEYIPLPKLPSNFDDLCVNLKKLELIPINDIGINDDEKPYIRVVSIDSPYREQISWAFINTIARPGVPSVNYHQWAECIHKCIVESI